MLHVNVRAAVGLAPGAEHSQGQVQVWGGGLGKATGVVGVAVTFCPVNCW